MAEIVSVDPLSMGEHTCQSCSAIFSSRNKLFKHLSNCLKATEGSITKPARKEITVDAYLYVFGGRFRGRTLGSVERYNLRARVWENCPALMENRGSHGAAAIDQVIYVCGGGGFDSNLATCESFDFRTQLWSPICPMKTYRHALAVTAMQANFSVFSEPSCSDTNDPNLPSNAVAEVIETTSCAPDRRWGVCAVGGWINGSVCSPHLEIYDPSLNSWFLAAPMRHPRRLLGTAGHGGYLYVFGGNCDDGIWYTAAVERYDPASNTWQQLRDLPCAGPTSAVTVGDKIFVFMQGKRVLSYDPTNDSYTPLSPLPLDEWFSFDVTCIEHYIFVHGGATKGIWSKALYSYDTERDEWAALPEMSMNRRRCAAAVIIN